MQHTFTGSGLIASREELNEKLASSAGMSNQRLGRVHVTAQRHDGDGAHGSAG
jgi:hypothetical protein